MLNRKLDECAMPPSTPSHSSPHLLTDWLKAETSGSSPFSPFPYPSHPIHLQELSMDSENDLDPVLFLKQMLK